MSATAKTSRARRAMPASPHLIAALALGAATLSAGAFAAFVAAPLVWLLVAQARACRRDVEQAHGRRSIWLAFGTLAFAAVVALLGALPGALVTAVAGAWLGLHVARRSLHQAEEGAPIAAPRATLLAGVALDEALRGLVELKALRGAVPEYARFAAQARLAADRNRDEGWEARPERAYPPPPPLEKVRRTRERVRGLGEAEVWRFASEFEPQDPEIRDAYLGHRANRTARVTLLRHGEAPRATLLYCHGYGLGQPSVGARLCDARRLHEELGIDVALMTLPLHGERSESWLSGEGVLDVQPLVTNAAIAQAVWELRRVAGHLRAAGAPALAVYGQSLGGYVASVFASVDERLASVVAMNTPASLDALFWTQLPPHSAAAAKAAGLTPHVLQRAWSRHAPLRMRPQVAPARRLVVGGLADRVVTPDQTRALWEHWGRPALHWYPGTHTLWSGAAALRGAIAAHLRDTLQDLR